VSDQKYLHVFISGTTNSGSGLLRGLLSQHPDITALPKEGHHYTRLLPRDRGRKTERLFALYPEKFRRAAAYDKVNPKNGKGVRAAYYKHWDLTKCVLLEKSPHNALRMPWMAKVFDPALFICLVRDGYAVAEGLRRRKNHDLARCAKQWSEANRIMLEDSEGLDCMYLSYEQLMADPQTTLDSIIERIGLTKTHALDLSAKIKRQNRYRKSFSLAKHPDFNAEARKALSDKDCAIIRKHAGEMLDHFGY